MDPSAGMIRMSDWASVWLAGKVRLTEKTRAGYQGILNSRVLPVSPASTGISTPSRWSGWPRRCLLSLTRL